MAPSSLLDRLPRRLGAPALVAAGLTALGSIASAPTTDADPTTGSHEAALPAPQADVRFNRDVRPLFSEHCFQCHGPDAAKRKAKLRLDRADGPEGAYRERKGKRAIVPGSLEDSELWRRVTSDDEDVRMPPPSAHAGPFDVDELATIRTWIEQGAEFEDHWAFVSPRRPNPPEVSDPRWCRDPLDRFVLRRLDEEGMVPTQEADARTLIRRLALDVTGLPPTRAEIQAYLDDLAASGDAAGRGKAAEAAYERAVDRYLASPHYGEHMAKAWLDLVRFADTAGIHHDHYRDLSPYRDEVIRAYNDNVGYDDFLTDQLAGDLRSGPREPTTSQLVLSGFHRLHLIIDVGTALPEESFTRNVVDRVTAFSTAFLGLTAQCAVCHDHKYDPIEQADFYSLSAFFNNIDAKPETGRRGTTEFKRGLQPPYIEFPDEGQEAALAEIEPRLAEADQRIRERQKALEEARKAKVPDGSELDAAEKKALVDARTKKLQQARQTRRKVYREREAILLEVPAAMVMRERREVRPAHILVRGDYRTPGRAVPRATPAFLPKMDVADPSQPPTRMDLARWLTRADHPLTARVAINRVWQRIFGVGLVATSDDFGTQGEWPSHPELLDLLALEFVESGWDVKALVKRIVMSSTYRQSSKAPREAYERDPDNRLLGRGARFRLDAEVVRDQILATSGLLARALYGKSVKPPQPPGLWESVALPDTFPRVHRASEGDGIYRRSVYTFWKRGLPPPQMTILDAPTRESCVARRERTNTPLQALLLLNEPEYLKAARQLARTTVDELDTARARVDRIYETITAHLPDDEERDILLRELADLEQAYREQPELAAEACGDAADSVAAKDRPALAALTVLTSTIYNLDITRNRN